MPAKAGVQEDLALAYGDASRIPARAGMTSRPFRKTIAMGRYIDYFTVQTSPLCISFSKSPAPVFCASVS